LVGKIGYSTLAEAYHSGTPFGYVPRRRFPEAAVLGRFAADRISGVALDQGELESGAWMDRLDALLTLPRRPGSGPNGADQIAEWLLTHLPFR
jgi:hypothetical protein